MASPDAAELFACLHRHVETVRRATRRDGPVPGLLPDALDVVSLTPPEWAHPDDGRTLILSNFANQQDLLRLLDGLSAATGAAEPAAFSRELILANVEHASDDSGLLHWGGHRAIDLVSGSPFGMEDFHELKAHYPYYEALHALRPAATRGFITAFWQRHVLDWDQLDLNRHGSFGAPPASLAPWPQPRRLAPVFFVGRGLSFINTGSDLFYAAALLAQFTGDERPRLWAHALARRYAEETRHPETGLGGYQFSRIEGDRAEAQLGPEFGERAREYSVLDRTRATRKFACVALCQLELAERLGAAGTCYLEWAVADLKAFARHAYDPARHCFHAVLRDGTRLSPSDVRRPGYYTPETFAPYPASSLFAWAYARAFRLTGDPVVGHTAASIARGLGLGDIAAGAPAVPAQGGDPWTLHALLEWHRIRGEAALLSAAQAVGAQILRERRVNHLFVDRPRQRFARVGAAAPLALLHLATALAGLPPETVPTQLPGQKYFTAHAWDRGRTSDYLDWFPQELPA